MHKTDKRVWVDKYLYAYIARAQMRERKNYDNILIIDGKTGTGKSTLAFQIAYIYAYEMGKSFTVDNVFFKGEEIIDYAQNNKGKVIVWDESAFEGMSIDWQNQNQRNMVKLVYTARKLNHFLIFIIPQFKKLQEVFAVNSSQVLIRVYNDHNLDRGYWKGFNEKSKEYLYFSEKNSFTNTKKIYPNVYGRFMKGVEIIDENAYQAKKDEAIKEIGKKNHKFSISNIPIEIINRLIKAVGTQKEAAKILGCSQQMINQLTNK